jgi:hypothetical protein
VSIGRIRDQSARPWIAAFALQPVMRWTIKTGIPNYRISTIAFERSQKACVSHEFKDIALLTEQIWMRVKMDTQE